MGPQKQNAACNRQHQTMKLSIVIPFHNEEKNIPIVLHEYKKLVGRYEFELVCVMMPQQTTAKRFSKQSSKRAAILSQNTLR